MLKMKKKPNTGEKDEINLLNLKFEFLESKNNSLKNEKQHNSHLLRH